MSTIQQWEVGARDLVSTRLVISNANDLISTPPIQFYLAWWGEPGIIHHMNDVGSMPTASTVHVMSSHAHAFAPVH